MSVGHAKRSPINPRSAGAFEQCECIIFVEQPLAPALGEVLRGGVRARHAVPLIESGADRRGVNFAHQLADVLHLAAAGLEIPDALRFKNGLQQALRQFNLPELIGVEFNQSHADLLQRLHFAFAL